MTSENNKSAADTGGMVDISGKQVTARRAVARTTIVLGPVAYDALISGKSPKGDVMATAKVAGVMAAKSTPQIIPLCHPLELGKVRVDHTLDPDRHAVHITAEVVYHGRTGVEMEALTAVSAAALTVYDMLKWADKGMTIMETRLLHKSGGKSGDYDAGG